MNNKRSVAASRSLIRLALIVSIVWGLLPLLMYSSSEVVQHAVWFLCFPAWILAYVLVDGVHGGNMDLLPIVCAVLTAAMAFGGILLVSKLFHRRSE